MASEKAWVALSRFSRKDSTVGNWLWPPAPQDAQVYALELCDGIASCLEKVLSRPRIAFILREAEDS